MRDSVLSSLEILLLFRCLARAILYAISGLSLIFVLTLLRVPGASLVLDLGLILGTVPGLVSCE